MINENTYDFAYMVTSYDMWHTRLGPVNSSYVIKLQWLGLINMLDKQSSKCDIRIESKLIKKTCLLIQRESKPLV